MVKLSLLKTHHHRFAPKLGAMVRCRLSFAEHAVSQVWRVRRVDIALPDTAAGTKTELKFMNHFTEARSL